MNSNTEKNTTLPEGWREVKLNSIATIKTGPFGAQLHQHDYVHSNGTPIVTVEHLSERGLIHKNLPLVSGHDKKRLSQYLIQEGDIVFSRVGSVDRSTLVSKKEDGWLFSGRLLRVRPQNVHSPYLNYFFHSRKFRHHMRSIAVGGTIPSINTSILSNVIVYLPPVNTQKAIASLLETWDTAIEKTEALIAAKEKRFKWLLKTLISDQQDNPVWRKIKLGDICRILKGQGLSKDSIDKDGQNKCILYGQLYTVYSAIISKIIGRTNTNDGVLSENGDVLIPGSTTTQGIDLANATALLEGGVLLGGDINILRAVKNKSYDSSFLSYYLTHSKKREIVRYTQGITIVHLYGKDLKKLNLSLPNLQGQQQIVRALNTARKEIDIFEQIAEQYRTQKRGLMQKLLMGNCRV